MSNAEKVFMGIWPSGSLVLVSDTAKTNFTSGVLLLLAEIRDCL